MVDRTRADQIGVASKTLPTLLVSLSSSGQTAPNFWLDPKRGVSYSVSVMTPQYKVDSMQRIGDHAGGRARGRTRSCWATSRQSNAG